MTTQVQALLNDQKALVVAVATAEQNKQTQLKLAEEAYQQRITEAAKASEEIQVARILTLLLTPPSSFPSLTLPYVLSSPLFSFSFFLFFQKHY